MHHESDNEQSKREFTIMVITGKYQISFFYVRTLPYELGLYCQDLGLIFPRNDRTLG